MSKITLSDKMKKGLSLARNLGYGVRYEMDGEIAGVCELRGKKIFILNLTLSPAEQWELLQKLLLEEEKRLLHPQLL